MTFEEQDPQSQTEIGALRGGLEQLGWRENNVRIDLRYGTLDQGRRKNLAKDLLAQQPEVIVTRGTPTTEAIATETRTIPIVFVMASDPVGSGFAASLAHPGGNITGFLNYEATFGGKWLELLKEAVPSITRVAVIFNPGTAVDAGRYFFQPIEAASKTLGVEAFASHVRTPTEVETAISALARQPGGGLIVIPDLFNVTNRKLIIDYAIRERVPAIYSSDYQTTDGGLISYGVDEKDLWRRSASYVDRILNGEKPGDLPVQVPIKFELAVNLRAARAIGLTIPESFLLRADKVIE